MSDQVAYKLLKLYVKLRNLGHLHYLKKGNTGPVLECCVKVKDAEDRVVQTELDLNDWSTNLDTLYDKFRWLLFFSVPRLLWLKNHLICNEHKDDENYVKEISKEISFLCLNNEKTRARMNTAVKVGYYYEVLRNIYVYTIISI